jgi:hypothetical protein
MLWACLLVLLAAPVPEVEAVILGGWVEDARSGAPIPGAVLTLYWATAGAELWRQVVDDDGSFVFHGVRPGRYLVQVSIGERYRMIRGISKSGERVLLTVAVDPRELREPFRVPAEADTTPVTIRHVPRWPARAP